ncbi:peptidoglycan-binding protein LysM [Cystobacter fuscus]|uniref:Peptidoglycan-binding protein LysM n=1 Tax=Cystobacter fuscus TaxID=43 RepID=A0A250JC61_9BACT|nr:LysM domain-containing protein [Cystobacter fuscus]ATB40991.1 peptidoglycan-binding protein LysM [Cystobacter fuscus]
MRSRILSSLLLAAVLAPPVWAQDESEPETGDETEGSDVVDEAPASRPGRVTLPPGQGGRESAPGEVHTVQTGDTLWDLSQRYLGSPWYWPKVWSYNPEIANPHWIYPGNNVRFFAAGEEVPSRVEAGVGPVGPVGSAGGDDVMPSETESGDVEVSGKISYAPKSGRSVMTQAFVTGRELDEAGRIEGSSSGAEMLSFPDTTYVRFKRKTDAKLGDRYVVFHTAEQIFHPVTKKPVGYLTEFVGMLRVTALGKDYVKAQVMETWDPVVRGDLVGPYGERMADAVVPRRNEKEVKGVILTALVPYLSLNAEHHILVIDRGSADGVQAGNTFTITRQGDPARQEVLKLELPIGKKNQQAPLPTEDVALCLVTEVKERTSNCLIVRSLQEVGPGDPVVMRVDSAPTAQR